ncbi:hypothetical protein EV175_003607 [Coemansia sp. RSA 1933]|nr:hypothetical protein EV175_003607 [Coemansia sp. RSA 1933]
MSEEELKQQIQALEAAISKHKNNTPGQQPRLRYSQHSSTRPYTRHRPTRPPPPAGQYQAKHRSRNMKLVVNGDSRKEQYVCTGNTLTKVGLLAKKKKTRKQQRKRVTIDGEEYMYRGAGGNKLVRVSAAQEQRTARRVVTIDDTDYVRTKRGGLIRVGALRVRATQQKPHRQRLCTKYMFGRCQKSDSECRYSHTPRPESTPLCAYFQRGTCSNPRCLFAHVMTNPNAPICRPFVFDGFCARAAKCPHRHVWECPAWVEKGKCPDEKCKLPHPQPQQHYHVPPADPQDDARDVRRFTRRPVFGNQHTSEAGDASSESESESESESSNDEIDDDVSNDEAEELLKWYDDTYADPSHPEVPPS